MEVYEELKAILLKQINTVAVIPTLNVSQYLPSTEAVLGENVTLTCNVTGQESGLFYWYKMNCGRMIQTVAVGYFERVRLEAQFKIFRFEVIKVDNIYSLIIRNIQKEDEATYFCQAGAAYKMTFVNGTNLAVNQYDVKTSQTPFGNTTAVVTGRHWYLK
uniref:Ig-like domain-containing protein n=1 Tax=Fundulus heteroclitus TaxID=8078 RepID=A0A3Q2T5B4_FUNHE